MRMALRELPPSAVHVSRRKELTFEEACDRMNENWVFAYEQAGVAIRDVLAGRVEVGRFAKSSHLEFVIDLIFNFFDRERENWTRSRDTRGWRKCSRGTYSMQSFPFATTLIGSMREQNHPWII